MRIPNVRIDENYNEKYLNEKDSECLKGYDCAVEQLLNIFNNLDVYPDLETIFEEGVCDVRADKAERVKEAMEDWAEMERNQLVTSMLDGYSDEEYEHGKENAKEK